MVPAFPGLSADDLFLGEGETWWHHVSMRVGAYVDGFNLYYGGRSLLNGSPGWKWLDLRSLATWYAQWQGATVERVVYCTARVNDPDDLAQTQRQARYLDALRAHGSVDVLEEVYYSSWAKESVMTNDPSNYLPSALRDDRAAYSWSPELPVRRATDGTMLARVRKREEKGSDVNVATHLLTDVLTGAVDAAIVISNDSDLALPIRTARSRVPVGLINPQKKPLAGALKGHASEGAGRHWWRRLEALALQECQMPARVGAITKPASW